MAADSAVTTIPDASVTASPAAQRRALRGATARTTPTKLRLLLVSLLALTIVWGAVAAWTVAARSTAADNIVGVSEPLALDAQQIYRSLSDADATEAAAFLSGGLEPVSLHERYQADIAKAALRLESATAAAGTSRAESVLATLAAELPVYTGLVETARADNRLGYPVGAAYLRQASALMRATLLPAAHDLYAQENAQLARANGQATAFPYLGVVVAVITGFGLIWSQLWLTRRTKRIVNPWLLLASGAGLATLIWLVVSLSLAGTQLDTARNHGSAPVEALARADIAALQAHADESLTLIDRGSDNGTNQAEFLVLQKQLGPGPGTLLTAAASVAQGSPGGLAATSAARSAATWFVVHRQVRSLDNNGHYSTAVRLAIGSSAGSSGALFGRVDDALTRAIGEDQAAFSSAAQAARGDLIGLEAGVIVLALLMAAGCAIGVTRRLAEYR
jgi:hypothetical protein